METSAEKLYGVLKRWWGFDTFRPVQERIIRSVLAGRDTLALMPTGGGKSLTYQVPAMASDGLCIVVTPLIALMKDQVDRLRARRIPAVAVHSGLSPRQIDIALDNCVYGDVKFLYVAPERLTTEAFRLRVQRMKVRLLAVDEAHCISQWGYDFRPAYLRIAELREKLPGVPVLALTASATPLVAEDIMRHLRFAEPHILRSSFARPNLSYSVRHVEQKNEQLLRLVRNVAGPGIVYVRTREATGQVADFLQQEGIPAAAYHGGLGHAERAARQDDWAAGRVRVMVATNAFGMGIDKADVRFVVHYTPCDSLESYYQEAGRAGRDGRRAYALLLVAPDDEQRIVRRFEQEFPPLEKVKEIYERVCSYLQIGIGDGAQTAHLFNIHDFCAREHLYAGTVQSALKLLQQNGYMTLTDAQENPARVMFTISRDDLYKLRVERDELDHFIRTLLRLYNGVFTEFRPVDEGELATWSGYTVERVRELLKRLWQLRVIRYIPSNRSPILFMDEERLPRADLYIAPETYRRRQELMRERFRRMLDYAANDVRCRSEVLEEYFGGEASGPCGICDLCLARKREAKRDAENRPAPMSAGAGRGAADGTDGGTDDRTNGRIAGGANARTKDGADGRAVGAPSGNNSGEAMAASSPAPPRAHVGSDASAKPHNPAHPAPHAASSAPAPAGSEQVPTVGNTAGTQAATAPARELPTGTRAVPERKDVPTATETRSAANPPDALAAELLRRLAAAPADPKTLAEGLRCDPRRVAVALRGLIAAGRLQTRPDGKIEIRRPVLPNPD